jgi:hypothetical protein
MSCHESWFGWQARRTIHLQGGRHETWHDICVQWLCSRMLATKSKIQNFHRSIKNPVCLLERRLLVEDAGRKQVDAIKQQNNSPAANKQQKSKDFTTSIISRHRHWRPTNCFRISLASSVFSSYVHRQEQPAVAQSALMSGPSVQHGNLEADPTEVFGQVFAAFGCAVQADDQLIAVNAVGARKLEKGSEAV